MAVVNAVGALYRYSTAAGAADITYTLAAGAQRLVKFSVSFNGTGDRDSIKFDLYDGTDATGTLIGSWTVNSGNTAITTTVDLYNAGERPGEMGSGRPVRSGSLFLDVTQGSGGSADVQFVPTVILVDAVA